VRRTCPLVALIAPPLLLVIEFYKKLSSGHSRGTGAGPT
jgi:hypothetical protein